jgi:glycosyltransferase involved in cell wall biosynthesis
VGGLRWQKFATFAIEFGWELDVITADLPGDARRDETRLRELPTGTRVFGVKPETLTIAKLERLAQALLRGRARGSGAPRGTQMPAPSPNADEEQALIPTAEARWALHRPGGWKRAYLAWRDQWQESAWARPAGRLAKRLAAEHGYAAVISSGPPHFAHVVTARLAASAGLPLVVDLRDPWALRPALPAPVASALWRVLARGWERRVVRTASLIVLNTDLAEERMRAAYPRAASRMITIMNGLDVEPVPSGAPRLRFLVAYAGNVYIDRNPQVLFRAAARLIRERELGPERLGLEFMGYAQPIGGQSLEQMAEAEGIREFVRLHPPAPRSEALRFLAGASLLVCLPQRTPLSTPSKVFEYMLFDAWHLVLAWEGTATARLLRDTSMAVVDPGDEQGIYEVLKDRFARFERGERPTLLPERERFLRATQARRFFRALDKRLRHR